MLSRFRLYWGWGSLSDSSLQVLKKESLTKIRSVFFFFFFFFSDNVEVLKMISAVAKADVKQQEIKDLVVVS